MSIASRRGRSLRANIALIRASRSTRFRKSPTTEVIAALPPSRSNNDVGIPASRLLCRLDTSSRRLIARRGEEDQRLFSSCFRGSRPPQRVRVERLLVLRVDVERFLV